MDILRRCLPFLLVALFFCFLLLAPGVWWGDSLNAYIQSVTGVYGTAQPVFMALFLGITGSILPGTLLPFVLFALIYYTGLAVYVFKLFSNTWLAAGLFAVLAFFPPLLANISVIQTETLQLAVLAGFIAFTFIFYEYNGSRRNVYFALLIALLSIFSIVRYDTPQVSILLSYWLGYTYFKAHGKKPLVFTAVMFVLFKIVGLGLDGCVGIEQEQRAEMRNSLLVTDIAAISAESGVNYVPDYCWQPYLPANERTVEKLVYGKQQWGNAFYSYIYSINPSVGLFYYNTRTHTAHLFATWLNVIRQHPLMFIKYHGRVFIYLLFNDYFNMGIASGLVDSHINHAVLAVDKSEMVDSFLYAHANRFTYSSGNILFTGSGKPITTEEEEGLKQLVEPRRYSDIGWMKWYSSVPQSTYSKSSTIAENYVNPFFELFKKYFKFFVLIAPYFLLLIFVLPFYRVIQQGYYRFTFFILCACGIFHVLLRMVILTDPVYRFGMITVLFSFFASLLLLSSWLKKYSQ